MHFSLFHFYFNISIFFARHFAIKFLSIESNPKSSLGSCCCSIPSTFAFFFAHWGSYISHISSQYQIPIMLAVCICFAYLGALSETSRHTLSSLVGICKEICLITVVLTEANVATVLAGWLYLMNWTTNSTGWHGIVLFTGALVLMSSLKMVFCLSSIVLRDLVQSHSWLWTPMGTLVNLCELVENEKGCAWFTLMIGNGSVWSMLMTGLESRSTLMIKNGIKIYTNETMGLLDERGLEAVAMTARGNLNNKEWLVWW